MGKLITAESVTEGHPDKLCDQISDEIVDAMLTVDPNAHAAIETTATGRQIHVFGEARMRRAGSVNIQAFARRVLTRVGYDPDRFTINVDIRPQSDEINRGVTGRGVTSEERYRSQGAGDQGVMYGYATRETRTLIPLPALLANRLAWKLAQVRHENNVSGLGPDGKTQVTIEYDDNNRPVRVDTILISAQHEADVSREMLSGLLAEHVVTPVLAEILDHEVRHDDYRLLVNPTGSFVLGGPEADAGLTGRKIAVDSYGGLAHIGGGALSSKDPSKVDRSGAYMARMVAKTIVAAGLAERAEVQVAYAIGVAEPVSVNVETFGTNTVPVPDILRAVKATFDLRPAAIIDRLGLKRPIYAKTAAYGHFGRLDADFPWEDTSQAGTLRERALTGGDSC